MVKKEVREFLVDEDSIHIEFVYDEQFDVWIGDFPCFEDEPRITKNGRLWKNVSFTGCPFAPAEFRDCGTCSYLRKQNHMDLIGVCFNDELKHSFV